VFIYEGKAENTAPPVKNAGMSFICRYPHYLRASPSCTIEEIPVRLETIHGASGFDKPGGAVIAAAKLLRRLGREKIPCNTPILVHEPGQGFFTNWLLEFLRGKKINLVLSGRNILSLEAARHNAASLNAADISAVPAADLRLGREALLETGGGQLAFIAAFPEILPKAAPRTAGAAKASHDMDQNAAIWNSLPPLLCAGGFFLAAFGSSDAERFNRKKPPGFTSLGSIKRNGFCARAYKWNG
jgi:hypothetical protein